MAAHFDLEAANRALRDAAPDDTYRRRLLRHIRSYVTDDVVAVAVALPFAHVAEAVAKVLLAGTVA